MSEWSGGGLTIASGLNVGEVWYVVWSGMMPSGSGRFETYTDCNHSQGLAAAL